jgi:hypothetical protein
MTPGALRILNEMAAGADLVRDGIYAYCGDRPVASRCVTELVWAAAVKPIWDGDTAYQITEMGEHIRKRPALEQEYYDWIRRQQGPCYVDSSHRLRPLADP